jgi:IclR family KDG regulon transcriptional repressor
MQQHGRVKTLVGALDVLNTFTFDDHEHSVSEIVQKLGMHKSKVSRILSTLASAGILIRSPDSKKYRLGSRVLEWATIFLSTTDLRTVVLPYIKELRSKVNETISLFVRDGDERICIEQLESSERIRMVVNNGERLPLHAGSGGKLLLAYLPEGERSKLIERAGLPRFTSHTITSREELEKELKKIRKQGFAVSFEERIPFAATVCAPIRNHTGEVVAALSIEGPVGRFSSERVEEYSVLVKDVTDKISQELGYCDYIKSGLAGQL